MKGSTYLRKNLIKRKKRKKQNNQCRKEKVEYFSTYKKMQREIRHKVSLRQTVFPYKNVGRSSAIDRTTSNYNDAKEKVKKSRELINTTRYDEDIAKYIPGLLELKLQGMLEDIDTREKVLILPTLAWKNLVFKYCLLTTTVLTQIVSTSAFL